MFVDHPFGFVVVVGTDAVDLVGRVQLVGCFVGCFDD